MQTIVKTEVGSFMVLPNDSLGKELIVKGDFEPHFSQVIRNIIKTGNTCIDAGANLGYHTVGMARLVGKNGHVISFEPLRIIYQQLCGNVFINDLRNVTCLNNALGNSNDMVCMNFVDVDSENVNIGGTTIGYGGDVVEIIKLDDLHLTDVTFMKIDVQGSEVRLLQGAHKTINKFRPIMFIEVENIWLNQFGTSSEELLNILLSMNYMLVRINTNYPCDHIAIPKEKNFMFAEIIKNLQFPYDIIDGKSVKIYFDRTSYSDMLYGTFEVTL